MSPTEAAEGNSGGGRAGEPPTPPVHYRSPRRLIWGSTLRPSPKLEGFGCREDYFEAHLCGSYVYCDLPVRLHACSPPRLTAAQLARSSVLNRLIAPAGLSPALRRALRAHRNSRSDPFLFRPLLFPAVSFDSAARNGLCRAGAAASHSTANHQPQSGSGAGSRSDGPLPFNISLTHSLALCHADGRLREGESLSVPWRAAGPAAGRKTARGFGAGRPAVPRGSWR